MSKSITMACVLSLALLGACDRGAPDAQDKEAAPKTDYKARIEALPEAQRNGVFIRAIRDAGLECQHVSASAYSGTVNGVPAWVAICDGRTKWTIAVPPTGIAQVMNTADLEAAAGKAQR